jgi:hypothetical protein
VTFAVCTAAAGPRSLAIPGSSSRELCLLSRVRCCHSPARQPKLPDAFLGVSLSFATPARGVHSTTGFPGPAYVPPSAFLALSTVYSFPYLAGLFHPTATSEIHFSGAFPAAQPSWLITSLCCPDLSPRFPADEQARLRQFPRPGLHSFDPGADPLASTELLRPPIPRSPLKLSSPSGMPPNTVATPSRPFRSWPSPSNPRSDPDG